MERQCEEIPNAGEAAGDSCELNWITCSLTFFSKATKPVRSDNGRHSERNFVLIYCQWHINYSTPQWRRERGREGGERRKKSSIQTYFLPSVACHNIWVTSGTRRRGGGCNRGFKKPGNYK